MPKIFVKKNSVWNEVRQMYIKSGGTWRSPVVGLVTQGGVGKQFYPDAAPTVTYTTPGSYTYTVPNGVTQIALTMIGGGGSGVGNYSTPQWPGPGGGSAAYFSNVTVAVTPGQQIAVSVGGAGANTSFGALIAGAGGNAPDRSQPNAGQGGAAGTYTGTGGTNGTQGNNGQSLGGNGYGANSPYGTGGAGQYSGNGSPATGYGAGGGGGGNNSGGGSGSPGFCTIVPITKTTVSYSTPGTYSFTVPNGVTALTVNVNGGAGGSGGNYLTGTTGYNGGSGVAGQLITGTMTVVPGTTYTVYVGSGGTHGNSYTRAGNGSQGFGGSGYNNGSNGSTAVGGGGGGGGGSSALYNTNTSTVELQAQGGAGGAGGATTGGAGGSGGGTNITPSGTTVTTGSNGVAGGSLSQVASGTMTYSSAWSTGPAASYAAGFNSIANSGSSKDQTNYGILNYGYAIYASDTGNWYYGDGVSAYTGGTVSGINTSHNGYTSWNLFYGDVYNNGGNGSVTISY